MRKSTRSKLGLASVLGVTLGFAGSAFAAGSKVWILTFDGPVSKLQALASGNYKVRFNYRIIPSVAVELTDTEAAALQRQRAPGLLAIEEDAQYEASATEQGVPGQVVPYGINMVEALGAWGLTRGEGTKVAVLDTGIDLSHPDAGNVVYTESFIAGETVDDGNGHGTHTAGTVAAADNSIGVVGVAPDADLIIMKVLSNAGSGATSGIIAGIDEAVAQGADVINMSLGGPTGSVAFRNSVDAAVAANVTVVAAAGNAGTSAPNYPAAFPNSISVSAVDSTKLIAAFSSFGPTIDLAAPGVGVLSTVPVGTGLLASASWNAQGKQANAIDGTGTGAVTQEVYYCGIGDGTPGNTCPPAVAGNIAHIRRGTISFADKVIHAANAGAAGIVISNNVPGNLSATIAPNTSTLIGVTVSQADGDDLVALGDGTMAQLSVVGGQDYAEFDGTSMASPHVAGVAALLHSCQQSASAAAIRAALESSAEDLGDVGRDDLYGNGLVNAPDALTALGPCGGGGCDADGDGYQSTGCGGDDCDDNNPAVNPGANERLFNGTDDDCNPATPANPACQTIAPTGLGTATSSDVGLVLIPLAVIGLGLRRFRRSVR